MLNEKSVTSKKYVIGLPDTHEFTGNAPDRAAADIKSRGLPFNREGVFSFIFLLFTLTYVTLIIMPVLCILKVSGIRNVIKIFVSFDNMTAVKTSLLTTMVSLPLVVLIGTPVAFMIKNIKSGIMKNMLEILINIPVVMPPAVAGMGLLLTFGRMGPAGILLHKFGLDVIFTPAAVVLAQFFVSSGFYIQVLRTGIDSIVPEIYEISYVIGMGRAETLFKVILPMLQKPAVAGAVLAWTRAMGEFGATIVFAGNVLGKTRTIPLQVYTLMQTDIAPAAALSMILFIISFIALWLVKVWLK